MSKIAISGASTGTATFTIESPATSTNRTLTLPDNTGTIITQNSTPAFASTIGVGGATAAASGAGITFPATASASSDANTLDDYEEGTFTTTFSGSSSGSGNVTSTARYTKIGNFVYIAVNISDTTFPSFSGDLRCSLPFTAISGVNPKGTDCYFFPLANWDTLSNFTGIFAQVTAGTAHAVFPYATVDGNRQSVLTSSNTNVSGQSNLYLNFTVCYLAA